MHLPSATTPHPDDTDLVQLLTPEGRRVEHPDAAWTGSSADLLALYRDLVLTRRVDTEGFALQRHGELGLWPPCRGQEAAQVGTARALRPHDMAFPTYRDHGVAWARGVPPEQLLGMYRGTDLGGWDPAEFNLALPAIIIGAQTLHATGYAMGLTLDGAVGTGDPERDAAVIVYLGDGATSQGDVLEAMSWAATFALPVVFCVENNQYAISAPVERQSAVPLVRRAAGFGFPGVRVDGNDVLACHAVASAALDRARDGHGPTLVEAVTYRMGAHTTSDDPTRYRDGTEADHWAARDPVDRLRRHLEQLGDDLEGGAAAMERVETEAEELGARLRTACAALPEPDLADQFDRVFVEPDPDLQRQREAYVAWRGLEREGAA